MEIQLEGSDDLPIRQKVNGIYERIIGSVFGCLQQLAKMDRADGQAAEDKGLLNYHVIMIGEFLVVFQGSLGSSCTSSLTTETRQKTCTISSRMSRDLIRQL